jgi:hypothetical protein
MGDASESIKRSLRRAFESPVPASRELYVVSLAEYEATGFTVHRRGDEILPKPVSLTIAQIGTDPGYYLRYLDDHGDEMTDTYYEDLDSAFEQAKVEFLVTKEAWRMA